MAIDLSSVSDDFLTLILLRVPVKDLIGKCAQVSPQFNRILSDNFFWRKKMEYDGYQLEWSKLVGLSTKSFKSIALKHCFGRNFIQDCWNLDDRSLTMDQRWELDRIVWKEEDDVVDGDDEIFSRIEIPPSFLDGQPEIPPGYAEPIAACIAIPYQIFTKEIKIKLADEGLTDEIMDNFRPTIIVSEMVANRRDCTSLYQRLCSLVVNIDADPYEFEPFRDNIIPNGNQREKREVHSDVENGRWVGASIAVQFNESEAEGWHSVEHTFKDYPKGMRYLLFNCGGFGNDENKEDKYGLKLANCSVKALLEKNA